MFVVNLVTIGSKAHMPPKGFNGCRRQAVVGTVLEAFESSIPAHSGKIKRLEFKKLCQMARPCVNE